jgi:hypothetical protein
MPKKMTEYQGRPVGDRLPTGPNEVVCELLEGPDDLGRYSFCLHWLRDWCHVPEIQPIGPGWWLRSQHFFADPESYKGAYWLRGKTLRLVDNRREKKGLAPTI